MNKTVIKDILREIVVNKSRFFSIMALLFISILAFSGIFMATILLEETPEKNYAQSNFQDLTVTSTLGLSDQDEFLIGTNLDVEDFEMSRFIDVIEKESGEIVRLENVPKRITTLILKEGRFPSKPNEIVLSYLNYKDLYNIGDSITFLDSNNSEDIEYLVNNEFEVVGFVNSHEYLTEEIREVSTLGSGSVSTYGFIETEAFNMDYYTKAKIKGEGLTGLSSFSPEYGDRAEEIRLSLEDTFKDRPKERLEEIRKESLKEIEDAEKELADARIELEDARLELEDAKRELEKGRKDLEEGKAELEKGQAELEEGRLELLDAEIQLREGEIELEEAEVELRQGEIDLKKAEVEIQGAKVELSTGWSAYEEGRQEIEISEKNARLEIEDGLKELAQVKTQLDEGQKQLMEGKRELEVGRSEINSAKEEFLKGEQLYLENLKIYEQERRDLDEEKEKIRISEEIKLGELNRQKYKKELESTIQKLSLEISTHQQNINNYNSQIQYIKTQLEESGNDTQIQNKINELNNLVQSEEAKLAIKKSELGKAENQLKNYNRVEQEGLVSEEVIKNSKEAIEQAERKLQEVKIKLDQAKEEIDKGRAELQKSISEFEAGEKELLESERQLAEGIKQYEEGLRELSNAEETLERELTLGRKELAQAKLELEKGEREYNQGLVTLREGKRQLAQGRRDLDTGKRNLVQGRIDLDEAKSQYKSGIRELEEGREELLEGERELEEGIQEYEEGRAEFEVESEDALAEIEEGEAEIEDAKRELMKLKEPTFMIDTRNADSTYHTINGFPESLKILAVVFSTLSLLISLLVAFTTMTRMVDERRVLIGTYKGLGHVNSVIASKFVLFGGISGLTGTILGAVLGQLVLAPIIYEIYMDGLLFSEPLSIYSIELLIAGLIMAIITTSLSAFLAVNKTLKENAASLLRPKAPKSGSRIVLERITPIWSKLSFMDKITARNIFRYKGRMAMTIIGVAVCMSLMILGFGMKYSISNVAQLQFGELQKFDLIVSISDIEESELNETINVIEENENTDNFSLINITPLKLQIPGENTQDVNLFIDLDNKVEDLVNFRIRNTNDVNILSNEGVIVTEKLAGLMNLGVGSTLDVEIEDMDVELKVSGIAENYLGHYIYMKSDYYEKIIGNEPIVSGAFVSLFNKDANSVDQTSTEFLSNDNILSSISSRDTEDVMRNTVNSIDVVIIIIVLIAMLLALVVLYNLTNINISERIRELSTMKVLGFFPKELTEYVYKETFILSLIGIFTGMGLGKIIVDYVIGEFAPLNIMFGDPNYPVSFAISAIFTIIFTLIVMVLMHYRLKQINMVEALKSVD